MAVNGQMNKEKQAVITTKKRTSRKVYAEALIPEMKLSYFVCNACIDKNGKDKEPCVLCTVENALTPDKCPYDQPEAKWELY